ncbi:bola protein [Fomitopsis serialis]|uniref:bola protein n=1 Tax=Fomitopsis serialis TaxID=139415 RepID=UPI0020073E00|nr:bola protein [Neoantrodia serialis]KAH9915327.1 bola protein [Neoantrodia serialis]
MPISRDNLESAIRGALPIIHLDIIDQSNGCGENYAVFVVSPAFEGKNTLARHRFINEVLKDQIAQMHAFSQKTLTPKQYEVQQSKEA